MLRSLRRNEFLQDILTTAVEGGIGYWSECEGYHWDHEKPWEARVVLYCTEDPTLTGKDGVEVDVDSIARALAVFRDPERAKRTKVSQPTIDAINRAYRECDAGDIDADLADIIVQVAIFDEVIFG